MSKYPFFNLMKCSILKAAYQYFSQVMSETLSILYTNQSNLISPINHCHHYWDHSPHSQPVNGHRTSTHLICNDSFYQNDSSNCQMYIYAKDSLSSHIRLNNSSSPLVFGSSFRISSQDKQIPGTDLFVLFSVIISSFNIHHSHG